MATCCQGDSRLMQLITGGGAAPTELLIGRPEPRLRLRENSGRVVGGRGWPERNVTNRDGTR